VIDILRLDMNTPEHQLLESTLDFMREQDARDDTEKVYRLLDKFRSGGPAILGAASTLIAFNNGQIDELILAASMQQFPDEEEATEVAQAAPKGRQVPARSWRTR